MPSRQWYLACLSLPGISSLWRQPRRGLSFPLINYRSSFSSGFTSRAGIKKLFFFFLTYLYPSEPLIPVLTLSSLSPPQRGWAQLPRTTPRTQQGHLKPTPSLPKPAAGQRGAELRAGGSPAGHRVGTPDFAQHQCFPQPVLHRGFRPQHRFLKWGGHFTASPSVQHQFYSNNRKPSLQPTTAGCH